MKIGIDYSGIDSNGNFCHIKDNGKLHYLGAFREGSCKEGHSIKEDFFEELQPILSSQKPGDKNFNTPNYFLKNKQRRDMSVAYGKSVEYIVDDRHIVDLFA